MEGSYVSSYISPVAEDAAPNVYAPCNFSIIPGYYCIVLYERWKHSHIEWFPLNTRRRLLAVNESEITTGSRFSIVGERKSLFHVG